MGPNANPFAALVNKVYAKRPWLKDLFAQQRKAVLSKARRKAVLCGRRSGKTVTAAAKLADSLSEADFDEAVIYAARTRAIARRLIWAKLHKLARDTGKEDEWTFSETDLTVTNDKGGYILLVGMDKPAEIEKLRGLKIRLFIGDEPATYASVLEQLYDEILEPACADLDGEVWFVGTPGKVMAGFWWRCSTNQDAPVDEDGDEVEADKWEVHHWTMFDNPHMREPRKFLDRVMRRKGWAEDNATVQQEYFGRWCADDSASVYRYLPDRNDHAGFPESLYVYGTKTIDFANWIFAMAVDFGTRKNFAYSVVGARRDEKVSYTFESGQTEDTLVDDMAKKVGEVVARWKPDTLDGDPGGGGSALINEWNARWAPTVKLSMEVAEKSEKLAHIEMFNTELRTARHKFCQDQCKGLTSDMEILPWANDKREKEHPAYANHRPDSNLYSWRRLKAFFNDKTPDKQPKTHLAPDSDEYLGHEIDEENNHGRAWWE